MRTYKEIREALAVIGYSSNISAEGNFIRETPFVHEGETVTDADIQSDISFLDAWTIPQEIARMGPKDLKALFPSIKPVIQHLGPTLRLADSLRDKFYEVNVPAGYYYRQELLKAIRNYVKKHKNTDLQGFNFGKFLFNQQLVCLNWNSKSHGLRSNSPMLYGTLDGDIVPAIPRWYSRPVNEDRTKWRQLPGLIVKSPEGKPCGVITGEQYEKLLPAIQAGSSLFRFLYTNCVWDETLTKEWDKAPEALENFRSMLKLLPQVTVYGAVPTRARYCGFGRESQGGVLRHIEEPYSGADNTLLFDGVAWVLLLAIENKPIQGRVVVTEDGRFVVSEWCFRETPYQDERYEMFSGAFTKHNLLTWCAGPLLDRFGSSVTHNTSMVDGRAPDHGNIFRMQRISRQAKLRAQGATVLRAMLKDDAFNLINHQTLVEMYKKGEFKYPLAVLCDDRILAYCTAPHLDSYYCGFIGFICNKAVDIQAEGSDYNTYGAINTRYYSRSRLIPIELANMILQVKQEAEVPQEIPQEIPVVEGDQIMVEVMTPTPPTITPNPTVPPETDPQIAEVLEMIDGLSKEEA